VSPPTASFDRHRDDDPLGAFMVGPHLLAAGDAGGPLSGTRFAVKDLFDVAGTPTGAGTPDWLSEQEPAVITAPAVTALLDAGADLWGKTVTDELAFSLAGTNAHYGTPNNPAAPGRIPGGSSSGSASAVAGGAVDLALGTDTGGSIRVPASYCGLFGLRPSHGRLDIAGVVPLAPSFDVVGLLASDGPTLAAGWRALVTGAGKPPTTAESRPVHRLVVARDLIDLADEGCATAMTTAAAALAHQLGLDLVSEQVAEPGQLSAWLGAFRTLQMIEAWRSHGAWIARRQPALGSDVAERFATAAATDPADGPGAERVRAQVRRRFAELLGDGGVLLQPSASGPAPSLDIPPTAMQDLRVRTLTLTAPAGLAGAPVVSLPLVRCHDLPVGLAVVGLPGDDDALVEIAVRAGALLT
jgi:amidase